MKKIFILVPILALLVTGCSLAQKPVIDNSTSNQSASLSQEQINNLNAQVQDLKKQNSELVKEKNDSEKTASNSTYYNLIDNNCDINGCLFNTKGSNYPGGIAVVKGYYSPVKRSAFEDTKTCDSFTITSGSQELIRAMVDLVDQGNGVHSKNQLNQPVINLGFGLINETEKKAILDSTTEKQIELLVFSGIPHGGGALLCTPDVTVLKNK